MNKVKVICIRQLNSWYYGELMLIYGKIYDAEFNKFNLQHPFLIQAENGWNQNISRNYVIPLAEWRDDQIDKILNDE